MSTITDCKSSLTCLAKDASVLEDQRMERTTGLLQERCSVGVGRGRRCSGHRRGIQMDLEQKDWWQ